MENENVIVKTKTSKGVKVVLIILIIMVLGLCGYIAYDKYLSKEEPKTNETTVTDKTTKDETTVNNTTSNTDEMYKQFIDNIKTRKNAMSVVISSNKSGDKAIFILGTDNKIYLETYNDTGTKVPGAVGSGGDYTGQYIGIDNVVEMYQTYHTPSEGGSYSGLLVLKEDGTLYILRNPADKDYNLEKLENKNIVGVYNGISAPGTTFVVDILGNSYEIK